MDTSSKRCMCRKGFRIPNNDMNKEQFRCVRNVETNIIVGGPGESNPSMIIPSTKPQNFKVQALQGNQGRVIIYSGGKFMLLGFH